jgi:hypothetical protein
MIECRLKGRFQPKPVLMKQSLRSLLWLKTEALVSAFPHRKVRFSPFLSIFFRKTAQKNDKKAG